MYPNLDAEMARTKTTKSDIAKLLKVRYATVLDKLNGKSRFSVDEALLIKRTFFPNVKFEYLFERANEQAATQEGA